MTRLKVRGAHPGYPAIGAVVMCITLGAALAGCCSLKITTETLPPAVEGRKYSFEMDSECGGDVWFLSAGTLPPGIALDSNGEIYGIPTVPGVYFVTLGVDDLSGNTVVKGYEITVLEAGP